MLKKKEVSRRKVAAYARVSKDSDMLLHSLANQVSYYSELINSNPEWEFAGIYVDEGISGTKLKNRDGFLRMMEDARRGKVDLIITKSVSRFARNTVDLLQSIRDFQELNVEVRFEKDGISTFDGEGELMLSLIASFAQAEAESISENVKWGKRKQMQEGIYHHSSRCYGYEWQGDNFVIVPEEAKVVRYIFESYIAGMSPKHIAESIKATTTTGAPFSRIAVKDILKNQIYTGDRVLQKFYSPKVRKKTRNYGELPQYVLEGVHEGIVSHEIFDQVQEIMRERAEKTPKKTFTCFTGKVKCGHCGRSCCRRTIRGKRIWKCQGNEISKVCDARYIGEDELRSITFTILDDEDDFVRKVDRIDLYNDHVAFIMAEGKTIKRTRKTGRRHQKNAGK
ncbi:recombinase family protein [Eubacterium sp. AB3007]|uniref:recombinase family protein n=1 Tax=Eubacterium sp. AB3007 TaxID=1392487 RepID=UPI00163973AD|nr:recombinase family protein [Eubacterium sp. AB3007]